MTVSNQSINKKKKEKKEEIKKPSVLASQSFSYLERMQTSAASADWLELLPILNFIISMWYFFFYCCYNK